MKAKISMLMDDELDDGELAGVLAANMSSLDALSVSNSALFVRNIYRPLAKGRSEKHYIDVGRVVIGVILVSGRKKGLLLPDLEGVDSVDEQLRITRMKAGILPDEKVEIFRFRVERFV
jgi:hypothetical protein